MVTLLIELTNGASSYALLGLLSNRTPEHGNLWGIDL
jgi:hypothetical protein